VKILHVVPWYEPAWATGGTAAATSMLCRSLVKNGLDITVYTTNDDGKQGYLDIPLNTEINLGGVKVYYFHSDFWWRKKRSFNSKGLIRKLKESFKEFDLIHLSSSRVWFENIVYRLSNETQIPYIITPHASLMEYYIKEIGNRILKNIYLKLIGSRVIKGAAAIHFLCEGERESSARYVLEKESFIVPNGMYIEDYKNKYFEKNSLRRKLNLKDRSIILLYTGRIHPLKNLDLVILALNEVKRSSKTDNFIFIILGPVYDKKYYEHLNTMIKNTELNNNIKILPSVDRERVKEFYWASDILVMPSKVEGISMSIIEALASSLPVLVSNRVANYHEIEEDKAGIVVAPDQHSITEAIKNIFTSDEYLKRLSINARRSAEKRYDIRKVASLMIKAYEDVLTGKRRAELQWR
jgi:glycosyltransferase involved in cell wall biosynthesis